ncbi:MAG: FtsX-like permease family protein [Bacteroidota bacterium]
MYLTFAWRYFKAKKSANAINIIAWVTVSVIAFATCCQILVLSVFNGFEGLVKSLYGAFYTDLKITPAKGKTFLLTPQQIDNIKKSNGINGISLIAEEKALLQNNDYEDNQQTNITLKGVDGNYKNITGVADKTFNGKFETGTVDDPGLVVGYGIQNATAINVDDKFQPSTVTLILPKRGKVSASNPENSLSEGNAVAKGVFSIQQEFDNKYAITNIDFVKQQMNFAADEYSAVEIKLNSNADAAVGQLSLQKMLGSGYIIRTKYQQNQSLYSTMKMEKWFIYAILTLILLVAAFNMISALTMLVLEKQKDITILQSMGAAKKMILKIFLSEGLLLAGIGAVSGIILALIICFLQVKFHLIKIQGGSFLIDYFPVKLELADFILVGSTVAFIAFLASWFPARKAANQHIELR